MIGLEVIDFGLLLVIEWLVVFGVNVVPALAPPTWAVLSFFYISRPQDIWLLVLIGVTASTCGRFALAKISGYLTGKFAGREKKKEFCEIERKLRARGREKFIFTFLYALSPLPSNALFIAFGATNTRLREVLAGFFAGRFISYLILVFTTEKVFSSLGNTLIGNANIWTIMIEVIGLTGIIIFFFIDWKKFIDLSPPKNKKKRLHK